MEAHDSRKNSEPAVLDCSFAYRSSWLDHLAGWLDGRQHSFWIYYAGFGAAILVLLLAALWIEGVTISGNVGIAQVYMAVVMSYMLGLIHYLDIQAGLAMDLMRPSLTTSDEAFQSLRYRITTLPAGPTILIH